MVLTSKCIRQMINLRWCVCRPGQKSIRYCKFVTYGFENLSLTKPCTIDKANLLHYNQI